MKIVPLNEVKNRFSTYLELSKQEDIVITKNGRPAAKTLRITCSSPTHGSSRGSKP
jgi:antitoxin (DNA-binding transcriptional repressor) of toxin-antitoxin stability system